MKQVTGIDADTLPEGTGDALKTAAVLGTWGHFANSLRSGNFSISSLVMAGVTTALFGGSALELGQKGIEYAQSLFTPTQTA